LRADCLKRSGKADIILQRHKFRKRKQRKADLLAKVKSVMQDTI